MKKADDKDEPLQNFLGNQVNRDIEYRANKTDNKYRHDESTTVHIPYKRCLAWEAGKIADRPPERCPEL